MPTVRLDVQICSEISEPTLKERAVTFRFSSAGGLKMSRSLQSGPTSRPRNRFVSGYVITELSHVSVENGNAATGKVLTTTVFGKEHGRWVAHLHTAMDVKPQKQ